MIGTSKRKKPCALSPHPMRKFPRKSMIRSDEKRHSHIFTWHRKKELTACRFLFVICIFGSKRSQKQFPIDFQIFILEHIENNLDLVLLLKLLDGADGDLCGFMLRKTENAC